MRTNHVVEGNSVGRPPAKIATLRWVFVSIEIAGLFVLLWLVIQEFFLPRTGDFDHEIYFGQRVALGELPWTGEHFDKLPAQQIFMALPSSLGGITAWRLISIGFCIWASLIVIRRIPRILVYDLGLTSRQGLHASALMVLGFFSILAVSPGGFTAINAVPASLIMIVSVELVWRHYDGSYPKPEALAALGFLAALAISFRPYFSLPFLFLALVVGSGKGRLWSENLGLGLVLWTGIGGIVINVGPYVLLGNLTPVLEGLAAVAGATRPAFTVPAMIFLLTSCLLGVAGVTLFLGTKSRLGLLFSGSIVLLTAMILSQHFWSHYVVLFSWYFSGLVTLVLYTILPRVRSMADFDFISGKSKGVILLLAIAVSIGSFSYGAAQNSGQSRQSSEYVSVVLELFEIYGQENVSFLAPRDMHVHWMFSESRQGLPGGQALRPIKEGRWEEKGVFESFLLPRNIGEYCEIIRSSNVRFVIVRPYHLPEECLGDASDPLFTEHSTDIRSNSETPNLIVWERNR